MFAEETYVHRRERLRAQVGAGLVLLLGNDESPMNYADNPYPFRQDSTFLYFFGLDQPGLAAAMDLDEGTACLFGDDPTLDEIVWTGPQPRLRDRSEQVGVMQTAPADKLEGVLSAAARQGRTIHLLPQYRPENILKTASLLNRVPCLPLRKHGPGWQRQGRRPWRWLTHCAEGHPQASPQRRCASGLEAATRSNMSTQAWTEHQVVQEHVSEPLIRAVVQQRSVKSAEEIEQIETALGISCQMHTTAMRLARPGVFEYEVAGAMEGIAVSHGVRLAFPTVFSAHGEIMHNPWYGNVLQAGAIAVNDSGAESPLHYASDVSRTVPIGGKFSPRQKEIYSIVLNAQEKAIAAAAPGIEWREVHRLACVALTEGLKELGLVKGDPQEAVAAGAHTLFFPCGVGHMLGLDVHDMEPLGEDYVGYTDTIRRNPEFGWRSLRLAKAIEPGFVVTVEPGIYFMPQLIDRWKAERRCERFIEYGKLEAWRHFGGLRVEDDVLVTENGCRVLGPPIPKSIDDVEALASA
jgi:Xaa-Pro aminopeptidase